MNETNFAANATVTVSDITTYAYDYTGAMVYIVVVLFWYSVGIVFMLGMQMRARSEIIEETARRRTKLLIRNLRDQTNTKEILEELVDKQKRARLWDIYLGDTTHAIDKLHRDETVRIRHIEKQLATINRNRRFTNETLFPTEEEAVHFRSRSDSRQISSGLSHVEVQRNLRRRSSFDQQTLERWKALADRSKTHEQMPWTIRKLVIRRYFRRPVRKPPSIIQQNSVTSNRTGDDLISFTNQIHLLTRHHSEILLNQSTNHLERQNPYLTYFYTSLRRPSILSSNFFSVSSERIIE
ncbi:unnamed protein product [Adineta ricciae]|uniref:Uncharacterized protein n=1 Tax=Adineta ricciae TaxID=249248 RepID=A0A814Q1G8_ADIRI|nr:unnamed protein product [Adineta ricciae]